MSLLLSLLIESLNFMLSPRLILDRVEIITKIIVVIVVYCYGQKLILFVIKLYARNSIFTLKTNLNHIRKFNIRQVKHQVIKAISV